MEVAIKEGKYIYCIIETKESKTFGHRGIGGRADQIYTICFNDIAAVVSDSPIKKYPVSRENLLPHEEAIEEAMKEHTVLPVRFATIAEDEAKVKTILEKEYQRFKDLLKEIKGRKELGLKAIFKEDIIYKYIVGKYEDIKKLKQAFASKFAKATYHQCMQVGEMVKAALEKEKENCREQILSILSPLALEAKINSPYGELMILNAVFLVSEDKEKEFDQKVNELGDIYGDKVKFKYVGTLPPFNFVNLVIETGNY